eukprot:scaffold85131_cov22-Prasinocladus_malaysianus.AAC.2
MKDSTKSTLPLITQTAVCYESWQDSSSRRGEQLICQPQYRVVGYDSCIDAAIRIRDLSNAKELC